MKIYFFTYVHLNHAVKTPCRMVTTESRQYHLKGNLDGFTKNQFFLGNSPIYLKIFKQVLFILEIKNCFENGQKKRNYSKRMITSVIRFYEDGSVLYLIFSTIPDLQAN